SHEQIEEGHRHREEDDRDGPPDPLVLAKEWVEQRGEERDERELGAHVTWRATGPVNLWVEDVEAMTVEVPSNHGDIPPSPTPSMDEGLGDQHDPNGDGDGQYGSESSKLLRRKQGARLTRRPEVTAARVRGVQASTESTPDCSVLISPTVKFWLNLPVCVSPS